MVLRHYKYDRWPADRLLPGLSHLRHSRHMHVSIATVHPFHRAKLPGAYHPCALTMRTYDADNLLAHKRPVIVRLCREALDNPLQPVRRASCHNRPSTASDLHSEESDHDMGRDSRAVANPQ